MIQPVKTRPGKKRTAVLAGFILFSSIALMSACNKHSQSPSIASRSYRMGFMPSAPRPDINLCLQSLALWTKHADAALISTDLHWDSLLNGEDPVTYVVDNYAELGNYFR